MLGDAQQISLANLGVIEEANLRLSLVQASYWHLLLSTNHTMVFAFWKVFLILSCLAGKEMISEPPKIIGNRVSFLQKNSTFLHRIFPSYTSNEL